MIRLACIVLLLAGCTPATVLREPYEVEKRVEVIKPIDPFYTEPLPMPALPRGSILVRDLVEHIEAWKAFGKTANEHRSKVAELSQGASDAL